MKTAREYYNELTAKFKALQKEPYDSQGALDMAHREFISSQLRVVLKELNDECKMMASGTPRAFFDVMVKADSTWREFAKLATPESTMMQEAFIIGFEKNFPTIYQMYVMFKKSEGKLIIPVKSKGGIR